ncbi:hypothetical protein [Prevotella jejuni]|uniref:hypothetical protein n=1 Tax=Prevotella jejuni TaxID=1177574 RepID=UPI0028E71B23|nr:hypothetical protein [Prevotella jejuni]
MNFRCDNCNNSFRALDIEYGQLLCQFQCPVQTVTAVTLILLTGVFSAFILSATTVIFIKESGKEWIKKKASVIANSLRCDCFH